MLEVNRTVFNENSNRVFYKNIEVLKKLDSGFWRIRIFSGELKVFSDQKLVTGTTVKGFLTTGGTYIKLDLLNQDNITVTPDFFSPDKPSVFSDLIYRLAYRLNIRLSEKDIALIRRITEKKEKGKFIIPALAEALKKGFKSESLLVELLDDLSGDAEKRDKGRSGREKMKKQIMEEIEKAEKTENTLFLFNHLKVSDDEWMYFPFSISDKGDLLDGTVRIRLIHDEIKNIAVAAEHGTREWIFYITVLNEGYRLKLYCSNPFKIDSSKGFMKFRKKLQNLGVKIDDNVVDINNFNGFDDENILDLDVTV